MYYADPVKLDASERTVEFSAELCQQRCQVVPECSHFTFWPDPGTIIFAPVLAARFSWVTGVSRFRNITYPFQVLWPQSRE